MKVSVICPTFSRPERHANLYRAFALQNYVSRELLILDDSLEKSPFFSNLDDERVKYRHIPLRASIGFKRNFLVEMASGEIIAHFDDDDFYATTYLTEMVQALDDADLIKLSKWLAWREIDRTFWLCDTRNVTEVPFTLSGQGEVSIFNNMIGKSSEWMEDFNNKNLWGYGFSYVYLKSVWEECHFDNITFGEDYHFICRAIDRGKRVKHTPNLFHLALHILHTSNVSKIFPQLHLDSNQGLTILGEEVLPWLDF